MAIFSQVLRQSSGLMANPRPSQIAFHKLLLGASVVGALAHMAFLILFYRAHVIDLVWINLLSITAYVACALMFRAGLAVLPLGLMGVELCVHAVLATRWIGWDSGFHYYLILVIPVALVSSVTFWWQKLPVVWVAFGMYVWLDYTARSRPPKFTLQPQVLAGLHHFNLISTLLVLSLLSATYYILIERSERRLNAMATTDPLTGLKNRRSLFQAAQLELLRHQRARQPLAFVLADLDHFKRINDSYGHELGDQVLKSVSSALAASLREIDHLARWGGEEFLAVLPNSSEQEVMLVAQRLRESIETLQFIHKGERLHLSITIGVSVLADEETVEQAISRADQALYLGKRQGRNQVQIAA